MSTLRVTFMTAGGPLPEVKMDDEDFENFQTAAYNGCYEFYTYLVGSTLATEHAAVVRVRPRDVLGMVVRSEP